MVERTIRTILEETKGRRVVQVTEHGLSVEEPTTIGGFAPQCESFDWLVVSRVDRELNEHPDMELGYEQAFQLLLFCAGAVA